MSPQAGSGGPMVAQPVLDRQRIDHMQDVAIGEVGVAQGKQGSAYDPPAVRLGNSSGNVIIESIVGQPGRRTVDQRTVDPLSRIAHVIALSVACRGQRRL